jgi:F0F1-type ATP synthase assembly protein I
VKRKDNDDPPSRSEAWKRAWDNASVGIEVALCITAGFLGGRWLDGRLDTYPWFMIIGFAAGVTAAGRALWRTVKRELKSGDGEDE